MATELGEKRYTSRGGELYLAGEAYYDRVGQRWMQPCDYYDKGTVRLHGDFPVKLLRTKEQYLQELRQTVLRDLWELQIALEGNKEMITKIIDLTMEDDADPIIEIGPDRNRMLG